MERSVRGVSPVIATVLLIVLVLVIAGVVALAVLPIVKNIDTSCVDAVRGLSFEDVGFTCKMPSAATNPPLEAFSVKVLDKNVAGFQVGFTNEGTADTYEVNNTSAYPFLCSLDKRFGEVLDFPATNAVKTYIVQGNYEKVFIAPILQSGKRCFKEGRRELAITTNCNDPDVKRRILACAGTGGQTHGVCSNGICTQVACPSESIGCVDECTTNATCTQQSQCVLNGAQWNVTSAREGDNVKLIITGNNCGGGDTVSLDIFEDDHLFNPDDLVVSGLSARFSNNRAVFDWPAVWTDDNGFFESNPPEYYFKATFAGLARQTITSSTLEANELKVYKCGDILVTNPEECDSTNLNGATCQSLGYTGGSLACSSVCQFDRSGCTNYQPRCGDNYCDVSAGESCSTCPGDCGACPAVCGNGIREGSEQCDNGGLNGQVCTPPYEGSCNYCSSSCQTISLQGGFCGDGIVNGPEQCELGQSQSCTSSGTGTGLTGSATGTGTGTGSTGTQSCSNTCTWGACVVNP